jgi:serine/threonine protein phosphatase 1
MAISRFLRRLVPAAAQGLPPFPPPPRPERPVAVVGDVHGRADLLERMLERLAAHPQAGALRVVLAGDLIDRGPDSSAVLARVQALTGDPAPFAAVICLMGNHERLLLDALEEPGGAGAARLARWLAHGGETTLASLGLALPHARPDPGAARGPAADLAAEVRAVLGSGRLAWLSALPLSWHEEGLFVAHAGADPHQPPTAQRPQDLLWGPPAKSRGDRRPDGLWVAQGHLIQTEPRAAEGRILVDTGAWRSGRLSAALLGPAGLEFVQVQV